MASDGISWIKVVISIFLELRLRRASTALMNECFDIQIIKRDAEPKKKDKNKKTIVFFYQEELRTVFYFLGYFFPNF